MQSDLTIVVPVYNAELSLPALIERIFRVMRGMEKSFEIILVDDGSSDGSWRLIQELATCRREIRGLRLASNMGQHPALLAGLHEAGRSGVIITLDDDLQHPPEAIPQLVAALKDNISVAYGSASIPYKNPFYRLQSLMVRYVLAALGIRLALQMRSFRAIRASLCDWREYPAREGMSVDGLLARCGAVSCAVSVEYAPRFAGTSTYTWYRSMQLAKNMLLSAYGLNRRGRQEAVITERTGGREMLLAAKA